jgi:hypothetical protein
MSTSAQGRTRRLSVLLLSSVIALGGCGDEPDPVATASPAPSAAPQSNHKLEWLRQTDGIPPELWLASREAGQSLEFDDNRVGEMQQVLNSASLRFRDHTRMIANRAVQLEGMLREKRIEERAPRIIVTLSQVPGKQRYVESFGSLTQQYYNLRIGGMSRAEAVDALRLQVGASQ